MPAPASATEFLDLVRKSRLLPDVETRRGRRPPPARAARYPSSVDQIASLLVREGQLTFFQAKQLKLGRYKRFTIGSKYRLLELIGAGGMGAVYLCEHTLMRRLVALKVLPVEKLDDPSNEERFYREARAVAALDHPNIVRAYDIDQDEKLHFLVMEYVDGTSLQEIVARYVLEKKQFDPIRAAHYIAQSAIGMQHGHELGMVHRDIKPGNLLLDRTGVIKVLDMGLARFFNKQQDSVTEKYDDKCVLGTADYLAPEQAVSNMVDIRADIYASAARCYFMLTGQTPFPDGTIAAKLVAHQTRESASRSSRSDPTCRRAPGACFGKMMAKDPADRYQEPIEVAEALAEWADLPITPPPLARCRCIARSCRRSPVRRPPTPVLPLARVLFGPGRGVFSRRIGSSGWVRLASALGSSPSTVSFGTGTGSEPELSARWRRSTPVGGPVSTARASASPTPPLPPRPDSGIGLPFETFGRSRRFAFTSPNGPVHHHCECCSPFSSLSALSPRTMWVGRTRVRRPSHAAATTARARRKSKRLRLQTPLAGPVAITREISPRRLACVAYTCDGRPSPVEPPSRAVAPPGEGTDARPCQRR